MVYVMDETLRTDPTMKTDSDYKRAIDEMLREIERLSDVMKRDQQDIESSRKRTREMLARLQAR